MTSAQTLTEQAAQTARMAAFSRFHTFSFDFPGQPPAGYDVNERSLEAENRVHQAVMAALVRKGYVETGKGDRGDFVVRLSSGTQEVLANSTDTGYEPAGEEAYVSIDIFDAANHSVVWHGVAVSDADPLTIDVAQLQVGALTAIAAIPPQTSPAPSVAQN
ncbi:MAG TPA: DUF4136 domain-containing protein [Polyangiaceae bacterium]|jgi:hypothetical protein|nr:DUF4136 domain-containing protein [Polyangiaceae bacterium]